MPQTMTIHAMNLGELETEVLRKLWITTSEDSNGFAPDEAFAKYSRYRVRKKINRNYASLVALTRTLRSWFIITLKANYMEYPVPLNCFDIGEVYYFNTATAYTKFDVYELSTIEEMLSPGWRTIPSTPTYAYVADRAKMGVKLGIAPAPSANGTAITLAATVTAHDAPYGVLEALSGSAAPGSATTTYIDSAGQNFSALGLVVGITIYNITDGSKGAISSLSTTNSPYDTIHCTSLAGGSANVWTPGDEMRVEGGEYSTFMEVDDLTAQYLLSPSFGNLPMPGVTMAAGNLLVRGFMYPTLLIDKYQYPELSPLFHYSIALGAAADLALEEPIDSPEYAQGKGYREDYNGSVAALSTFTATQYKTNTQLWSRRK